jgi:diguanylate cyclase (GGDEF)-like protein
MPTPAQLRRVIDVLGEIAELGLDLSGVMQLAVDRVLQIVSADGAAIELGERHSLVYRAASGIASSQLGVRVALDSSLSGLCLRSGQAQLCLDAETDERVDRLACRVVGLRAMVLVPLMYQGAPVGVLKAMSRRPQAFGPADVELLANLSRVVGAAMYWSTRYGSDSLFHRATHDELTGLSNRAMLMDRLHVLLNQARRQGSEVNLLMLDMDGLKAINDGYGHAAGDAALQEFGRRLSQSVRAGDTVARLGGDEFAILAPQAGEAQSLAALQGRLHEVLEQPFTTAGEVHSIAASLGWASFPLEASDAEQLLARADERMYADKRARKARHAPALPADPDGPQRW